MISVIVPVYNGEKTLEEFFRRIKTEIEDYSSFEVIFVYDCGNDKSWEIIKELCGNYPDLIKGYHFDKNYGQHYATSYGLKKANGDFIFTLDEDNQHDPKFIPEMIKYMNEKNLDLIYGQFHKIEQPIFRVILSSFLRRSLCLMIPNLPGEYSSYRLFRKDLLNKLNEQKGLSSFIDADLGRLSQNHASMIIDHFKRMNGDSSYTLNSLLRQAIDIFFKYSKLFKRLFSLALMIASLWLVYTFHLLLLDPIRYKSLFLISLISFSTIGYFGTRSLLRVHRKKDPIIVEQINS